MGHDPSLEAQGGAVVDTLDGAAPGVAVQRREAGPCVHSPWAVFREAVAPVLVKAPACWMFDGRAVLRDF